MSKRRFVLSSGRVVLVLSQATASVAHETL